jgi:hypothetical protein
MTKVFLLTAARSATRAAGFATTSGEVCYQGQRGLLPRRWGLLPGAARPATRGGGDCYHRRWSLLPTVMGSDATHDGRLCYQAWGGGAASRS